MNSLSSLVILLQLVLQLLSNSATANSPQTQVVVQQAIGYATETLASSQQNTVSVSPSVYIQPQNIPPVQNLGSMEITESSTSVQIPTLASNSFCQNPGNQALTDICNSTSTAMCGYQEPSVEGGHLLTMSCIAIQLCSLEHDCP